MSAAVLASAGSLELRRPGGLASRGHRRLGIAISIETRGGASATSIARILNANSKISAPFASRGEAELAGLLPAGSDPVSLMLPIFLAAEDMSARWAVVAGEISMSSEQPGEFNGQALWRARALLEEGRDENRILVIETGEPTRDGRLAVLAPWVGEWLVSLSPARRAALGLVMAEPRLGPARIATRLAGAAETRISKQAISQFLRHSDTRRMRSLLEIVRSDAMLPRPDGDRPASA